MKINNYISSFAIAALLFISSPVVAATKSSQTALIGVVSNITATTCTLTTLRSPIAAYTVDISGARVINFPVRRKSSALPVQAGDLVIVHGILSASTTLDVSFMLDRGAYHAPHVKLKPTVAGIASTTIDAATSTASTTAGL